MEKKKPVSVKKTPLLAAQASSKRKNPPNAKDDLPPKKPKPEGYAQARMRVAGTLYGIYAGDTSDGDPLLDFKEFLDALPPQFWTFPGSMGFNDNRTIFPFILIAEGKKRMANQAASTKSFEIKRVLDIIDALLPDISSRNQGHGDKFQSVKEIMHGLMKVLGASCVPVLDTHISVAKDNLKAAQALQESLDISSDECKPMKQVVDGLKEKVERMQ